MLSPYGDPHYLIALVGEPELQIRRMRMSVM